MNKMIKRFSMEQSKKGLVPMSCGITLSKSMYPKTQGERTRESMTPYDLAIGSIMYAILCTRPNVSYALSVTSRYHSNLSEGHWVAVKNILKYLRMTKDVFLIYGHGDLIVSGYTNAIFQSYKDDFKFQSNYVPTLNGGTISRKSSKHNTTTDSTT